MGGFYGVAHQQRLIGYARWYRLVYEVRDQEIVVVVVAVGRRDRNAAYKSATNSRVASVKKPD